MTGSLCECCAEQPGVDRLGTDSEAAAICDGCFAALLASFRGLGESGHLVEAAEDEAWVEADGTATVPVGLDRVYICPPAPFPMAHGCWRCGAPFEKHTGDAMWCPQ